jgi:hypothetical protein
LEYDGSHGTPEEAYVDAEAIKSVGERLDKYGDFGIETDNIILKLVQNKINK